MSAVSTVIPDLQRRLTTEFFKGVGSSQIFHSRKLLLAEVDEQVLCD